MAAEALSQLHEPCYVQKCDSNAHTHTHTHTHFRVSIGKTRKPFEKNGWPEGRQACDGMKTKNKSRQARRTRSPLQHAARKGAARTGAGCREAVLRPTQRRLGRPAEEHENGRPTGKRQLRTILRATREHVTKEKRKKESAREKDGTHIAFFTEPHPGSRRTEPPDDDGGILANCRLRVAVSAPNFVRKYAFCSHFQILRTNRAATPETTMQQKMKKSKFKSNGYTFKPRGTRKTSTVMRT